MMNNANKSIKCNVCSCKYNDKSDYCTLDNIQVGTDKTEPKHVDDTECVSFKCD